MKRYAVQMKNKWYIIDEHVKYTIKIRYFTMQMKI